MAKYFFIVETNCTDPMREKEFNDWYDKIHLPDVAETPVLVKATRYEITEPAAGKGKFLAIYEIECKDPNAWIAALSENMKTKGAQGRMSPLLSATSRAVYKQITSFPK